MRSVRNVCTRLLDGMASRSTRHLDLPSKSSLCEIKALDSVDVRPTFMTVPFMYGFLGKEVRIKKNAKIYVIFPLDIFFPFANRKLIILEVFVYGRNVSITRSFVICTDYFV